MVELIHLSLYKIREEAATRTADLNKERNAFISSALPVELYTRIFSNCMQIEDHPLRRLLELSYVSVRWWDIIRTTASLWTTANPAYEDTEIALTRSRNLPLTVTFKSTEDGVYDRNYGRHYSRIRHQIHRWQSVSINTDKEHMLKNLLEPLPMLQSLDMHFLIPVIPIPFPGGPMLRHLRLSSIDMTAWSRMDLPQLETLEVQGIRVRSRWGVELVQALAFSTRLRTLNLVDIGLLAESIDDPTPPLPRVTITGLTGLTLEDITYPVLASLLTGIRGPHLSRFHFRQRDFSDPAAVIKTMGHDVDLPSLLLCTMDNAGLSEARIQVSNNAIEIRHPDRTNSSLDFLLNTFDPADTMAHLTDLFTSKPSQVPVQLHFTSRDSILHEANFLHAFSTLSEIAVNNIKDASILLRHILQTASLPNLETFGFDAGFNGDEQDFVELVGMLKEMLRRRPQITVWDWHMQAFEWGLEAFSGRTIPSDMWLDVSSFAHDSSMEE